MSRQHWNGTIYNQRNKYNFGNLIIYTYNAFVIFLCFFTRVCIDLLNAPRQNYLYVDDGNSVTPLLPKKFK